jgi:hypothetical protein
METAAKAVQRHLGSEDGHWFLYAALYLVGAVVVGVGMSQIVEMPVLKLRDRFFPSRSQQPVLGI